LDCGACFPVSTSARPRRRSSRVCTIALSGSCSKGRDRSITIPTFSSAPVTQSLELAGTISGTELFQIKGFPYRLEELLCDPQLVEAHRNGRYVTLRLTSSMYHRFHAPHDCRMERVTYISGDTWNVNPIALRRVEKLFCKNERALLRTKTGRYRSHDYACAGCGHIGCQHPAALPQDGSQLAVSRAPMISPVTLNSKRGMRWAGFSMDRPSSCLCPMVSSSTKMWAKAGRSGLASR